MFDCMKLTKYVKGMFKGNRSMKSFHNINNSPFGPTDPISKLHIVRYCGTEHNNTNMFRKHDDSFFPDNTSFLIINIMNFIKNNPLNIPDHFSTSIQIIPKYFSSHDDTTSLLIHTDITSYYSHRVELLTQFTIFLIG